MNGEIELGYWPIKLKAHHLRYLLAFIGLQYTEWNPKNILDWRQKKDTLYPHNPLVTIPYYKEGDLVVSKIESIALAICMRAGRRDLMGETPPRLIQVRTLSSINNELLDYIFKLTLHHKKKILIIWTSEYPTVIKPEIEKLANFLGDKEFLLGQISYPDFELCHVINLYQDLCSSCSIQSPFLFHRNLLNLAQRVENLPGVKEYVDSAQNQNMPWHNQSLDGNK